MTYINLKTAGFQKSIVRYYYFTANLVASDLRARFRRTMLGASWAVIQPLFFTLILSTVFSAFNDANWVEYSVYVFSGLVIWEMFAASINLGSSAISSASHYLRQYRLPVYIFPIRVVLLTLVTTSLSTCGLAIWIIIFDIHAIYWTWLLFPFFMIGLAIFVTPFAIVASYLGLLYRDFENVIGLLMTAMWFWSPVFMAREVFDHPRMQFIGMFNPARAFLDIGRGLLIEKSLPRLLDLGILAGFFILIIPVALMALNRLKRDLYYYL